MMVNADFTITVRLGDIFINPLSKDDEIEQKITEEGEKRLRYYLSGYLFDPDKKVINKNVTIHNIKKI